MSVASRWAAWERRRGRVAAGPLGGTDPEYGTFSPRVELFIDEAWVDITRTSRDQAGVYYRDRISISRGKADETSTAEPQTCMLTLNNRDGRFSPTNPLSPYFGKLGRNTPIRVSVLQNGIRRYRFYGEVSAWPVKWDVGGNDVYVPIVASGVRRRLQQGNSPIKSAVYRDMTSPTRSNIVAYWPFEDGSNATTVASGLPGQAPLTVASGAAEFGSYSDWFGSDPLPLIQTAVCRGRVPPYTATGETSFRFFVKVNTAISTTYQELIRWKSTGSVAAGWVSLKSNGNLRMILQDSSGTNLLDTSDLGFTMNTEPMATLTVELSEVGGGINWRILASDIDNSGSVNDFTFPGELDGSVASQTVGRITDVIVNGNGGLGDVAFGQLTVANLLNAYADSASPLISWNDEGPRDRIRRLCREEGISEVDLGTQGNGVLLSDVTMGNQHPATLIELLQQCETTGLGVLYELRDQIGIGYRTRVSLYNQSPHLTLDYTAGGIGDSLNPTYDDQFTRNDITVARTNGSSARVELTEGPLSVNDPPDGVGRYDDTPSDFSIGFDDQLLDQAGWRVHLGTVDEARYPQISLQLSHPSFTSDVDLTNAALTLDVGDRLVIQNPPSWLPPDDIDLIVFGYTETFDQLLYDMTLNCVPGSPYQVGVVDDTVEWRVDTEGSLLAADLDETSTTVSVATGLSWVSEDFEDAALNVTVTDGGNLPWARTNAVSHSGSWSLKSGAITNSQTSDATVTVPHGATMLTFWYKVSSEPVFDGFVVLVDGVQQLAQTGDSGWVQRTIRVDGASAVTFRYSKDPAGSAGDDAAYIDDLQFTAGPLWTTDPADFPMDVRFGGEKVTVSAISGTSSPQTFTVTRSANGVVKSHAVGTPVKADLPTIVSL